MKVVIIGVLPESIFNFREQLILKLVNLGHDVTVFTEVTSPQNIEKIKSLGVSHVQYPVNRTGLNPFKDIQSVCFIARALKLLKPDVLLCYTIKPVIWGGMANYLTSKAKFCALITGLGYTFNAGGGGKRLLRALVAILYKLSLRSADSVIFQNRDNMNVFIDEKIVDESRCHVVNGSGVDLSKFRPEARPKVCSFLLIARLLRDKGVREYLAAAKIVKRRFPDIEFHLVGPKDSSPNSIEFSLVEDNVRAGFVNYHGNVSDVRSYIDACSVYVLPSYHEGLPKSVLEAMAKARPIITTDVPGCRETVQDGLNGFLIDKKSVEQLVDKMIWFIQNPEQGYSMGMESLKIAQRAFDVNRVNDEMVKILGLDREKSF